MGARNGGAGGGGSVVGCGGGGSGDIDGSGRSELGERLTCRNADNGPPPATIKSNARVEEIKTQRGRRMRTRSVSAPSSRFAESVLISAFIGHGQSSYRRLLVRPPAGCWPHTRASLRTPSNCRAEAPARETCRGFSNALPAAESDGRVGRDHRNTRGAYGHGACSGYGNAPRYFLVASTPGVQGSSCGGSQTDQ